MVNKLMIVAFIATVAKATLAVTWYTEKVTVNCKPVMDFVGELGRDVNKYKYMIDDRCVLVYNKDGSEMQLSDKDSIVGDATIKAKAGRYLTFLDGDNSGIDSSAREMSDAKNDERVIEIRYGKPDDADRKVQKA